MISMVDFYVDADDVLGSSYNVTSLECNNYNPNIDGTVTVTVTVKNVYDDPVVGEVVTVTSSEGNFTELNGTAITESATVDGTTDASGQFTLTYSCTIWGLITFSANNTLNQINVTGWREVDTGNTYTTFLVNEGERTVHLMYDRLYNFTNTSDTTLSSNVVPSRYRPTDHFIPLAVYNPNLGGYVDTDGSVHGVAIATGSRQFTGYVMWTY